MLRLLRLLSPLSPLLSSFNTLTNLPQNGITYLAQVLKRNRTLKVLNLAENKIDVVGLGVIADALVSFVFSYLLGLFLLLHVRVSCYYCSFAFLAATAPVPFALLLQLDLSLSLCRWIST